MRKLTDIYDELAEEKANMAQLRSWIVNQDNPNSVLDKSQTLLNDLRSSSKVAIWRLFLWVVAFGIWVHEGLWEQFQSEIESYVTADKPHTLQWYRNQALLFQFGDKLIWQDGRAVYEANNPQNKIVSHAATSERNNKVVVKVAKEVAKKEPLSQNEIQAFRQYINTVKDAGVAIQVINSFPDLLLLQYRIYYDPLVLADDGTLLSDYETKSVNEAIQTYLDNLEFDGKFVLSACEDAIQQAEGVVDFERLGAKSKYGGYDYVEFNRYAQAFAGYFVIDPENDLDANIEYVSNV